MTASAHSRIRALGAAAEPASGWGIAGRSLIYARLILWAFISLFPIYWTITTSFKVGGRRHAGPSHPVGRLHARLEGLAVARPVARHDLETSTVREEFLRKLHQQRHRLGRRLDARRRHRLARGLWAQPLRVQVRAMAQQGHLVLLPVAADPAAGRARAAVPRSLQGARRCSTPASASILVYTLMVLPIVIWIMRDQFDTIPHRAGGGGAGRRLLDLGRVLPHRPADRAAGHGRGLHPVARAVLERVFLRRAADQHRCQDACR